MKQKKKIGTLTSRYYLPLASGIRLLASAHCMYVTKQENSINIQVTELRLKKKLFIWWDHEVYAYNEYMLISSMLITRVYCMAEEITTTGVYRSCRR